MADRPVATTCDRDVTTAIRNRRLCFPVAGLAALENFDPTKLCYFLQRPSLQPSALSSWQRVEHDVPVRDSIFSLLSCPLLSALQISFRLTQWLERPIFSQLSTLLPILPAAVCALIL